jgi:hypothetical protein
MLPDRKRKSLQSDRASMLPHHRHQQRKSLQSNRTSMLPHRHHQKRKFFRSNRTSLYHRRNRVLADPGRSCRSNHFSLHHRKNGVRADPGKPRRSPKRSPRLATTWTPLAKPTARTQCGTFVHVQVTIDAACNAGVSPLTPQTFSVNVRPTRNAAPSFIG